MINKIKKNYKILFCFSFIGLGILSSIFLFVFKPTQLNIDYVHDEKIEFEKREFSFPIIQNISVKKNRLTGIWLYLEDDNLNEFQYTVKVVDETEKVYFEHYYEAYNSNIIYMGFSELLNSKNKNLQVQIICDDCNKVIIANGKSKDDGTFLQDTKNQTLKIGLEYRTRKYDYYWYSIFFVVFGTTLLPLAKEEKHEKD